MWSYLSFQEHRLANMTLMRIYAQEKMGMIMMRVKVMMMMS